MMRIGVPRALSFFRFHPAWQTFFQQLGVEFVVSPPSNRVTLETGRSHTVPENCLPLKLFYGHVCALAGQVDYLLAPSIHRFAPGSTNCAKLIGLPDLLRATIPNLPPLLAPDIDLSRGLPAVLALVTKLGLPFTYNPLLLRDAVMASWSAYLRAREAMRQGRLTPAGFDCTGTSSPVLGDPTIAVVGHPYNLYDPFVNHNLLARLDRLGVGILTPERLGPWPVDDYWAFEYELIGATKLALDRKEVAGIIAVLAFGCGPDGAILEEVQRLTRAAAVPLMTLTLDEHSAEAGLLTRIEAFVDMLNWRRRRG
jgi:predicted nucleotide-binding protein (sugar kinase/HSP70/actin superfamily)